MRSLSPWLARHRLTLGVPAVALLTMIAQPVSAAGDPNADVNNAAQQLLNAKAQARAADQALAAAQAQLVTATAQLAALEQRITALDGTIAADTTQLKQLNAQVSSDKGRLAAYLRQSYESGGSQAALLYLISAKDITAAIHRKVQLDHVASAAQQLIDRIDAEATQAARTLEQDNTARAQLGVAESQAQTAKAVVAVQAEQVQAAAVAAHQQVSAAQNQLSAAQAALAAARAAGTVYSAVPGSTFTIDTDLTVPSGENAAKLDGFLQGTPMAGLGESFMHAEQAFHVSARYFVAHAILESTWGASAIAHDKHNLFGFNADDADPYAHATTFPSFDACIQYVAQYIATNYLSPNGKFYHGPTLRGMNVSYATDPNWAAKIAKIARTVP